MAVMKSGAVSTKNILLLYRVMYYLGHIYIYIGYISFDGIFDTLNKILSFQHTIHSSVARRVSILKRNILLNVMKCATHSIL